MQITNNDDIQEIIVNWMPDIWNLSNPYLISYTHVIKSALTSPIFEHLKGHTDLNGTRDNYLPRDHSRKRRLMRVREREDTGRERKSERERLKRVRRPS